MGDHRAYVSIEFRFHGKTNKQSWDINWFDDGDGIDERIVEWFRECTEAGQRRYQKVVDEVMAERNKAQTEKRERTEYERLKEKFGKDESNV